MWAPTAFLSATLRACSLALVGCGYDLVDTKELKKPVAISANTLGPHKHNKVDQE
jgi:hypothetical protein